MARKFVLLLFSVVIGFLYTINVHGLDNGLALTPPMGWLAWERFRCNIDCKNNPDNCISQKLFTDMADHLAKDGYRDVGYNYINVDDCWMAKKRNKNGRLYADKERFPKGIKYLAEYMHKRGLKLGIYGDFGTKTCGGYPGSEFHLQTDAETFANWKVDSLKLDGCNSNTSDYKKGYPAMGHYLNKTGRPILYSCSWPAYLNPSKVNYTIIAKACNLWRNYGDIQDSWDSILSIVDFYGNNNKVLSAAQGPGHWNDPDQLIVGDFSLSYEQSKSQFALWSIFGAPLYMSNDLRKIPTWAKDILQNREVIAVNQDKLGLMGKRIVYKKNNYEVWMKNLSDVTTAVVLFNRNVQGTPQVLSVDYSMVS
ncbi:uncharacterized protein TRIADDRAFT_23253 [Trichoplax adhaerens]|uniref:Alpha-galactosidase n=1 Tax=Trichoplax adhaerens TaxID=10228 RepID=B3RSE1_TRIAD|nr:hypothetical protein TRIADDRAFT_23253 [Trichoplax adhaerens]EDV27039.1 hypothetical protein TRIADDRAFT_23253 [Trichoplax adhaerens]|eukprot:XP_002111035.1 hypothetical protein TRIADDRAFT_23253 [Trichoplax adhaerens]